MCESTSVYGLERGGWSESVRDRGIVSESMQEVSMQCLLCF